MLSLSRPLFRSHAGRHGVVQEGASTESAGGSLANYGLSYSARFSAFGFRVKKGVQTPLDFFSC